MQNSAGSTLARERRASTSLTTLLKLRILHCLFWRCELSPGNVEQTDKLMSFASE